jgi:DNA-binding NtrC family response regulator
LLARYFLNRAHSDQKKGDPLKHPSGISKEAFEMLTAFSWPGNVRQLEQAVMAALTICESDQIQPSDFPTWFLSAKEADFDHARLPQTAISDQRYLKALESTKYSGTGRWNFSAAARKLGVPRKTFIYRLKKMQLIK